MARMTLVTMVMAAALLSATGAATQQTQGDVVVIVPEGYDVTHTAVPTAPTSTTSTHLATPPPTQLQEPMEIAPSHTAESAPRTRANRGLVIPGIVSLAVGYGANIVGSLLYSSLRAVSGVSNTDEFLVLSFIPVAGPWAQLPFASSELEVGFLIGAGTLQAAGLTMLIAGLTFARRPVNEVALGESSTIRVDPMLGGDVAGVTATGTF